MCKAFRNCILMANDNIPKMYEKDAKGKDVDDNVLHQLQNMFGFLALSDK